MVETKTNLCARVEWHGKGRKERRRKRAADDSAKVKATSWAAANEDVHAALHLTTSDHQGRAWGGGGRQELCQNM